jgi:hypothetical protein
VLKINIATNRPKRPLSSYFLFLKEYTQKHGATVGNKSTLVIKAAANAWNNLNASEKEVYGL